MATNENNLDTIDPIKETQTKTADETNLANSAEEQHKNTYSQDERMVLKAPMFAKEAISHRNKILGIKKESREDPSLKVKYLPKHIREKQAKLEQEFIKEGLVEVKVQEPNLSDDPSNNENLSSLYLKSQAYKHKMNAEKNVIKQKIARNLKLFFIIIIAFIGFYLYNNSNFFDNQNSSLKQVQAQLPLKLDPSTTLTEVRVEKDVLLLGLVKSKDAFANLHDLDKAVDLYLHSASLKLCKIPFILDIIKSGKNLKINLQYEEKTYQVEIMSDKCSL